MDVTSIASVSTDLSQIKTTDAVQMAVLKRSIDIQAQGALQLLEALPKPVSINPPNLGKAIDTFA